MSEDPKLSRAERNRLQLRADILQAAFVEFSERGYHQTAIADIARRLGIGHGTFYRYFENKRDILEHVIQDTALQLTALLAAAFAMKTRDEWAAIFAESDACVAPILSMSEAPSHPHNAARGTFVTRDGTLQPAPAPRFLATPAAIQWPSSAELHSAGDILSDWD